MIISLFLLKEKLLLDELSEIKGLSFSKAAQGSTTRKRILKRFRDAGLIEFERGRPISITEIGRQF